MLLAHTREDGEMQGLEEHLNGTAKRSEEFAAAFGAASQGWLVGQAHDIGKYSDAFQNRLLRGGPIVDHSTAGAVECAKKGAVWAALCVAGHHAGLPDFGNLKVDIPGQPTLCGRLKGAQQGKIPPYTAWPGMLPEVVPPQGWAQDAVSNAFFVRMLYSCLVDADYLDTEQFMHGAQPRGGGDTMDSLLQKLNEFISPWQTPGTQLNQWRCEILNSCISKAQQPPGLFTLTVPTGGGKTVASLAFALQHAATHGLRRVVYVVPYTSIIEQTADVFRKILGEENVLEHHSGADFSTEESASPQQYRAALAAENWDVPVVVTTAVQFFESLYANRSSKCRKLHNLAGSVILFDEAQMLPVEHLLPCVSAIAQLVRYYGVSAVLCTATQPALGELFAQAGAPQPVELCPDQRQMYQRFRRVSFRDIGKIEMEALAQRLKNLPQVLCIVNSRREAQELFALLPPQGSYHLSTLMVPAHRRALLGEVRKNLQNGLPCRVVSTSLVEAGVDVDFPAVYREIAGLDSILQAAGRCNREGKRPRAQSIVTVFESSYAPPPMLRVNVGAMREALASGAAMDDLSTIHGYFTSLLSLRGPKALDKYRVLDAFEHGIEGCSLPFATVGSRFHLIDSPAKTVYVPWGQGGEECISRLREGQYSRGLYRQLGQYGVTVYEQHYRQLAELGALTLLQDGSVILNQPARFYSEQTGLTLQPQGGQAIFD